MPPRRVLVDKNHEEGFFFIRTCGGIGVLCLICQSKRSAHSPHNGRFRNDTANQFAYRRQCRQWERPGANTDTDGGKIHAAKTSLRIGEKAYACSGSNSRPETRRAVC